MSDKKTTTEKAGLSRRGFLGATAVTGATLAAGAATMGGTVMTRESWAAAVKDSSTAYSCCEQASNTDRPNTPDNR